MHMFFKRHSSVKWCCDRSFNCTCRIMKGLSNCASGLIFLLCLPAFIFSDDNISQNQKEIILKKTDVHFSVQACQFAVIKFRTGAQLHFTLVFDLPQNGGYNVSLRHNENDPIYYPARLLNCTRHIEFKANLTNTDFGIYQINVDRSERLIIKCDDLQVSSDTRFTKLQIKTIWNIGKWKIQNRDINTTSTGLNENMNKHDQWKIQSAPRESKTFQVKACKNAQVVVKSNNVFYSIIIGRNNNTLTQLYINKVLAKGSKTQHLGGVLDCNSLTNFSLSVVGNTIELKKDDEVIIQYALETSWKENNLRFGFQTVGVVGYWKFDNRKPFITDGNLEYSDFEFSSNDDETLVTLDNRLLFSVESCQYAVIQFYTKHNGQYDHYLTLTIDQPYLVDNILTYRSSLCSMADDDCSSVENRLLSCSTSVEFEAEITRNSLRILTQGMELLSHTDDRTFWKAVISTVWSTGRWSIDGKDIYTENSANLDEYPDSSILENSCTNTFKFGVQGHQRAQIDIDLNYNEHGPKYAIVIGGLSNKTVQVYQHSTPVMENVTNSVVLSPTEYTNFTLEMEQSKISLFFQNEFENDLLLAYDHHDDLSKCRSVKFHNYWVQWKFHEKEMATPVSTTAWRTTNSHGRITTLGVITKTPLPRETPIFQVSKAADTSTQTRLTEGGVTSSITTREDNTETTSPLKTATLPEISKTTWTTEQAQFSTDGDNVHFTTPVDVTESPLPLETTTLPGQEIQSVEELAEEMKATKEKLTVNRKKTATYKRTKICAEDNRVSSVTIGSGGIVFLVFTCVIVIAIDLPNLKNMFVPLYQNLSNSEIAHAYRTWKKKRLNDDNSEADC